MENENNSKVVEVLLSPADFSAQSLSMDSFRKSESSLDDAFDSCVSTHKDCTEKEFEYNQFFISAETSSLPEKNLLNFLEQSDGSDIAAIFEHNDKHMQSDQRAKLDQIFIKTEDCEVLHGILESEGFVIPPSGSDLQTSRHLNNGCDGLPESSEQLDGVDCIDQKSCDKVDGVNKATSKSATILVAQSFLNDIKQNSETRSKILEEVSPSSSADIKADAKHLKTELELIEKLDMKIQQLESMEPSTCSSRYWLSSEGSKGIPTTVLYLRKRRKTL